MDVLLLGLSRSQSSWAMVIGVAVTITSFTRRRLCNQMDWTIEGRNDGWRLAQSISVGISRRQSGHALGTARMPS